MMTNTFPQAGRTLVIRPAEYTCPVTGDVWKRDGSNITCSDNLICTGKSYIDSLPLVSQGYRMADSEIIAYLAQRTEELKAEGRNPREVLEDPLFDRQIRGEPYVWEHTNRQLRPPNGAEDFTGFVEHDKQGRKYSRVDVYSGDRCIAKGALMPWGWGSKVVEINPALGMPSVVSDGQEPQHVMHSYFKPERSEVAVVLAMRLARRRAYDRCLGFRASYGRSNAASGGGFRLVQGSLDDIQLPTVKRKSSDDRQQ